MNHKVGGILGIVKCLIYWILGRVGSVRHMGGLTTLSIKSSPIIDRTSYHFDSQFLNRKKFSKELPVKMAPPHGDKSAEVKEEAAAAVSSVDNRPISTILFIVGTSFFFSKRTLFVCFLLVIAPFIKKSC